MGKYVGGHAATPGVLVTIGCSCLFIAISAGVLTGGDLMRFDRSAAEALHAHASQAPGLTISFRILGTLEGLVLVSVMVAATLLVLKRWSPLVVWLVAVIGGEALNLLLKEFFARPRPHFESPLVVETSYSYPSGQAMESLVVYGMLASRGWGKRAVSVGGAAVLVGLIGLSRLYLGAHYFSDIAGGFAAGGAWLSAVITGRGAMRRRNVSGQRGRPDTP